MAKLAAEAAAGDPERTRKFLSLLSSIPSERTELRHVLIGHLDELITSPETLAEVLPFLYSALVGASTLERGAAAKTIGEIQHKLLEDAPPLLLEALVALLWDKYFFPMVETVCEPRLSSVASPQTGFQSASAGRPEGGRLFH